MRSIRHFDLALRQLIDIMLTNDTHRRLLLRSELITEAYVNCLLDKGAKSS
jgi:hypothetical protein